MDTKKVVKKVVSVIELKAQLGDVYYQLERLDQMAVKLQNDKRQLLRQIAAEQQRIEAAKKESAVKVPEAPKKADDSENEKVA